MSTKKPTQKRARKQVAKTTAAKPEKPDEAVRKPAVGLNLHQRLLGITEELSGGPKKGGQVSAKAGGYSFHKADDVEKALAPLLVRWGVMVYVTVDDSTTDWRPDMYPDPRNNGKPRGGFLSTAEVRVVFVNADKPDDRFAVAGAGLGVDRSDKPIAKAVTYGTKNVYIRLFHLSGSPDNEDDAEERGNPGSGGAPAEPVKTWAIDDPNYPFPMTREHKGQKIGHVPDSLLTWCLSPERTDMPAQLLLRCRNEVDRREALQADPPSDVPEVQISEGATETPDDYGEPVASVNGAPTGSAPAANPCNCQPLYGAHHPACDSLSPTKKTTGPRRVGELGEDPFPKDGDK